MQGLSTTAEKIQYVSIEKAIPMRRVWAMPSASTFDIPPIRALVKFYLHKSRVSVDPFARSKRWATYTNDLNPNTAAEWHMDAEDFVNMLRNQGVGVDLVLFDPPYSPGQIVECYQAVGISTAGAGKNAELYRRVRDAIDGIVLNGGRVLSCGWHSNGMGVERGYEVEEMLIVAHGGAHNDTIVTVERKVESMQTVLSFDQQPSATTGRRLNLNKILSSQG